MENFFAPMEIEPVSIVASDLGPAFLTKDGEKIPVYDMLWSVGPVQPGSVANDKSLAKHVGEFCLYDLDDDSRFLKKLTLIPYGIIRYPRVLYPDYESGKDQVPICKSYDGIVPHPDIEKPKAAVCAVKDENGRHTVICDEGKWQEGKGKDGKDLKPRCSGLRIFFGYDIVHGFPVVITLKGKAVSSYNTFKSPRNLNKKRNIAMAKRQNPADLVVDLSLENEGTFFGFKWDIRYAPELCPSQYYPLVKYYAENIVPKYQPTIKDVTDESNYNPDAETTVVSDADSASEQSATSGPDAESDATASGFTV